VVIKPVNEGSSIGISKAPTLKALETGLAAAFALDNRVLVEEFIQGTEVTGGVLGNASLQALPLVEIVPASTYTFFDYEAKYQPGATEEICPARLSPEMTQRAQKCALTAHQALGCRGYSRTDMMIRDQEIYVLETNTIPGMTATSLFPQGAKAAGIDFPDLLDTLITGQKIKRAHPEYRFRNQTSTKVSAAPQAKVHEPTLTQGMKISPFFKGD
jgi:D-alanine-D-alanine ligase